MRTEGLQVCSFTITCVCVCVIIKSVASHVARKRRLEIAHTILVGKRKGKIPLRWCKLTWEVNIERTFSYILCQRVDWINLAEIRNWWRALVDKAMNLRDPLKAGFPWPATWPADFQEGLCPVELLCYCILSSLRVAEMPKMIPLAVRSLVSWVWIPLQELMCQDFPVLGCPV
jgi:hypothetical protein